MAESKGSCSTIVTDYEIGHHLLKIAGYSRIKSALSNGKGVKSDSFRVGDRSWRAEYYPNGRRSESTHSISLYLFIEFLQQADEIVKAKVTFSLLDHEGKPAPSYTKTTAGVMDFSRAAKSFGVEELISKEALENSGYLKEDCFTVRIDVTVVDLVQAKYTPYPLPKPRPKPIFVVKVPPSDMQQNFADLLASKEGFDVKFLIGGETIEAHRLILAARSRVFKAQLFGQMKESATTTDAIPIDDMEAKVFRSMLTFIYTDALPLKRVRQEDELAMTQHLLVAADRYALERLKLICEHKLCDHVDADSLPTLLALADQHHCHGLKEACLSFKSSPITLKAFMESEGFQYLTKTCPSVLKDLINPTSM